jgi:hypothetical protein
MSPSFIWLPRLLLLHQLHRLLLLHQLLHRHLPNLFITSLLVVETVKNIRSCTLFYIGCLQRNAAGETYCIHTIKRC